MKEKRLFPVGFFIPAAWILFNPNITLIDILPDAIAYALILCALRHLTSFVPYMREASEGFRRLFYLSIVKLPALVVMLTLATQRVTITLFSLSFAVLELIFLLPAVKNLFEGLFYLGERFDCPAALRTDGKGGAGNTVCTVTYIFLIAKAALSTLPDFCFLFEYDPLTGEGFTITSIQYLFVVAVAFFLTLIVGILWLSYILPYLRGLAADEGIKNLKTAHYQSMQTRESRRLQLSLPFFLFATATVLSLDIVIDRVAILPDYLAASALLALAVLFYKQSRGRWDLAALCLSVCHLASTVVHSVLRSHFYTHFIESDIHRIPAANAAYTPVIVTSAISETLFIALFILLGLALHRFYRQNNPDAAPTNEYEHRLYREEHRMLTRQNLLLATLAVLTSVASFLNVLFVQYTKRVEMSPGHGDTSVYIPTTGSFWLVPFLLSAILVVSVIWLAGDRTHELFRIHELEDERISAIE